MNTEKSNKLIKWLKASEYPYTYKISEGGRWVNVIVDGVPEHIKSKFSDWLTANNYKKHFDEHCVWLSIY